jgi:hypothetical protein
LKVQSAQWAISGLGIQADDQLRFEMLYREALERGDVVVQRAVEEWPLRSPISAELRQQGQRARDAAKDPLLAKEIADLEALHAQRQRVLKDALAELPLEPVDEIARMAAGESVIGEGR